MTDVSADHGRVSVRPWSVSQSHALEQCPREWWFRYEAHVQPAQPRAVPQLIGSAIHAGLEGAYTTLQRGNGRPGRTLSVSVVLEALAAFSRYWDANAVHVREYEREDAERLLLELLKTLPTPAPGNVLAVEQRFTLTTPTIVSGVMDLVLRAGMTWIHIRDWKLGSVPTKPEELEHNIQLATYVRAAQQAWPWATRITVGLFSIRERREVIHELHPESVAHATARLVADAEEAETRARSKWIEPRTGDHCNGCRFRSYCPAMVKIKNHPVEDGVDVAAVRAEITRKLRA